MSIARVLPEPFKQRLRQLRKLIAVVPYMGNGRYCPVCDKSSRTFAEFGTVPREDARCMHCGALERHRLTWLYLQQETDLFDGAPKRMLHIAPESVFRHLLQRRLGTGYLTADLSDPEAMVKMDITDIQYPDGRFDVIYCSHVLEHVPDDRRAMRELHRVLNPNGWAIVLVPITVERTFEKAGIDDPAERFRLYGHEDHVRRYGPDFVRRLRTAGFTVQVISRSDFLAREEMEAMGITEAAGDIYYCEKTSA